MAEQPLAIEGVDWEGFALTPRQERFLLARAENRIGYQKDVLKAAGMSDFLLRTWRKDERFKRLETAIVNNPETAAHFLLAWSQPDAAKALRRALESGARVATDSARFILGERKRAGTGGQSAEALLEAVLRRLQIPEQT